MSLIRKNYTLSSYTKESWVIEIFGQHFIISTESKLLIDILSVSDTYDEAVLEFNLSFNEDLTKDKFLALIKTIFLKIPIFNDDNEGIAPQKNFIKFQKPLIKAKLAEKLIYPFKFLYHKKVFWTLFAVLSVAATVIFIQTPLSLLTEESVLLIAVLYTPTVLLHELGHIAACNTYTKKNGDIGFGVYFIFPVFYSDVSAAWHATKEERIIVNLSGIYMQLLCMLLFIIGYFTIQNNLFLQMAYILAVYSFIQLIPFVRSDGYWLLSDLSSTPNLQKRSNEKVIEFIKKPFETGRKITSKNLFILFYGLFNSLIFGYFIATQIIFNWKDILYFPLLIPNFIKKIIMLEYSQIEFPPHTITTIIFYMIVYGYIKKIILAIRRKFSSTP